MFLRALFCRKGIGNFQVRFESRQAFPYRFRRKAPFHPAPHLIRRAVLRIALNPLSVLAFVYKNGGIQPDS
jgi:hypothetical protein